MRKHRCSSISRSSTTRKFKFVTRYPRPKRKKKHAFPSKIADEFAIQLFEKEKEKEIERERETEREIYAVQFL